MIDVVGYAASPLQDFQEFQQESLSRDYVQDAVLPTLLSVQLYVRIVALDWP